VQFCTCRVDLSTKLYYLWSINRPYKTEEKLIMLKKLTTLSMALLFPVIASAYTPKKEALLVGIDHYKSGETLPGIRLDINQMKKLLESRGFHVRVLFNRQATLANVTSSLNSYRKLSSNDSFFFYDSSHGTQVPDLNGDESDGLDEAFVLYDVNPNIPTDEGLLIDDNLNNLLAKIPAKKVMVTDACHSGTIYKSFSRYAKTKFMPVAKNFKFVNKERVTGKVVKPKNLVVFGASSDNQLSIATSDGSLFTEAFYDAWSTNPNITFQEMQRATNAHIQDACNHGQDLVAYTPTLYSTNRSFVNQSMDRFLQVNIKINPKKYLVEEYFDGLMAQGKVEKLNLSAKSFYKNGEHIQLAINTLGQRGHLYILTSKESENELNVLYPNHYYQNKNETWKGDFTFPNAKTPFAFQADNQTRKLERTVVYTILSKSIIPELEVSRVGYNQFQSIFRDFKGQTNLKNAVKDIIIKRKNNQISMDKTVFSVGI